ncbi:MAG: hypothetical protein ACHP65_01060 [Legionellales bacterium]
MPFTSNQIQSLREKNAYKHDDVNFYEHLKKVGFNYEQMVEVVKTGGINALTKLHDLVLMYYKKDGQWLVDEAGLPFTELNCLLQNGFTHSQLIEIASSSDGFKNLEALKILLQPVVKQNNEFMVDVTPLVLLQRAGFTAQQLIDVLRYNCGSKKLEALKSLLQPVVKQNNELIVVTSLVLLQRAGFTANQLIDVLNNIGGSKNLGELIKLVQSEVQVFLANYPNGLDIVMALARRPSKSAHLQLITAILSNLKYQHYIDKNTLLRSLCRKIEAMSAKKVQELQLNSIDDLEVFCQKIQTKSARKTGRSKPGKKVIPTPEKELTIAQAHQEDAFIDDSVSGHGTNRQRRGRESQVATDEPNAKRIWLAEAEEGSSLSCPDEQSMEPNGALNLPCSHNTNGLFHHSKSQVLSKQEQAYPANPNQDIDPLTGFSFLIKRICSLEAAKEGPSLSYPGEQSMEQNGGLNLPYSHNTYRLFHQSKSHTLFQQEQACPASPNQEIDPLPGFASISEDFSLSYLSESSMD